tara:strand:+ start:3783 stop:4889 length:1107 start_codon:yes stop_codon:yes gene_type:complete
MSVSELPNISLVTILHDNEEFYPLFQHHWDTLDYPKDKLEWIIVDDSKKDHGDLIPIDENILYLKVDSSEYLEKIEFPKDDEKITWNYFSKTQKLTNGFMRDYAVGMTSHDYIFHIDVDTIYQPKALKRKLRFLKDHRLDCVYCKAMLCYDIYGKQLYKTEGQFGYESTLFHTKELWKKNGFKWEDIISEAVAFYYNKGNERKMDNFYDTIKLLSIKNANNYRPVRITLENMEIKIPEIVHTLQINQHPLQNEINDLFFEQSLNVLGINSEIVESVKGENKWEISKITYDKKEKEKKLIQKIQELNQDFDICFINTKFPIWNIFDKIKFKCIIDESEKNREQMNSILEKKGYISFNYIYIHKDYLLSK